MIIKCCKNVQKKNKIVKSPINLQCIFFFNYYRALGCSARSASWFNFFFSYWVLTSCKSKTRLVSNIQISYQTFVVGTFLWLFCWHLLYIKYLDGDARVVALFKKKIYICFYCFLKYFYYLLFRSRHHLTIPCYSNTLWFQRLQPPKIEKVLAMIV